ncbi:MAG: hypothetical protein AAB403_02125 [Planctomycetota bacterium]
MPKPKPRPAPAAPETVTQFELRAVLQLDDAKDRIALAIAQRLAAGARIEPGPLWAVPDDMREMGREPLRGLIAPALEIGKAQEAAEIMVAAGVEVPANLREMVGQVAARQTAGGRC